MTPLPRWMRGGEGVKIHIHPFALFPMLLGSESRTWGFAGTWGFAKMPRPSPEPSGSLQAYWNPTPKTLASKELQLFNAPILTEVKNVFVLKAPPATDFSEVRFEGEKRDIFELMGVFRFDVLPIFAAGCDAVANVA